MFIETLNNMTQIEQTTVNDKLLSDAVPVDCAKTIPLYVVDGFKAFKIKKKNTTRRKHFWNSMISRGNVIIGHLCTRKTRNLC